MLIEFYGLLSKDCKKKYDKKSLKLAHIICTINFIVLLLPVMIFGIVENVWHFIYLPIGLIVLINLVFFILAFVFREGVSIIELELDTRIIIENNEIAVVTGAQAYEHKLDLKEISGIDSLCVDGYFVTGHIKTISEVLKVIDYWYWYEIVFKQREKMNYICQKDLIVTGTIEDFEKLFEGKIVRKIKKDYA